MIGLPRGVVLLAEYDSEWQALFAEESGSLRYMIGEYIVDVQHVGSTSIEGLIAKPVIDIVAGARELNDVSLCAAPLESIGYQYKGENGIPGRHYFGKGNPRIFHLHFVEYDGKLWRDYINFRDRLREDTNLRNEYARLKKGLAARYKYNREAYTESKGAFVKKILTAKD